MLHPENLGEMDETQRVPPRTSGPPADPSRVHDFFSSSCGPCCFAVICSPSTNSKRSIRMYVSTGHNQWTAQEVFGEREGSIACLSWMPSRFELPMIAVGTSTGRVQVGRVEQASRRCLSVAAYRTTNSKPTRRKQAVVH